MHSDPLVPAGRRWPRTAPPTGATDAGPTGNRPFVLVGAAVGGLPAAKHRTPSTSVRHSQPTTSDGKNPTVKTDEYTTPDD